MYPYARIEQRKCRKSPEDLTKSVRFSGLFFLPRKVYSKGLHKATGKIKKGCEHMTNTIFYNGLHWENQRTAFHSFRKSDAHRPMVFAISWWTFVVLAYNSLMVAVMGCMRIRLTGLYTASSQSIQQIRTSTDGVLDFVEVGIRIMAIKRFCSFLFDVETNFAVNFIACVTV